MGKSSLKETLGRARRPEKKVPVCLRGDLAVEVEELERRHQALMETPSDRMVGNVEAHRVAERIAELTEQARADTVEFHLRALPRRVWLDLLAEHPARPEERRDYMGANADTLFPALLRRSVVSPQMDEDDWVHLLGGDESDGLLTSGQYDLLCGTVWDLNRGRFDIPFSSAVSQRPPSSGGE